MEAYEEREFQELKANYESIKKKYKELKKDCNSIILTNGLLRGADIKEQRFKKVNFLDLMELFQIRDIDKSDKLILSNMSLLNIFQIYSGDFNTTPGWLSDNAKAGIILILNYLGIAHNFIVQQAFYKKFINDYINKLYARIDIKISENFNEFIDYYCKNNDKNIIDETKILFRENHIYDMNDFIKTPLNKFKSMKGINPEILDAISAMWYHLTE